MIDQIAVVSHPDRAEMGADLARELDGLLLMDGDDQGSARGCARMHTLALRTLAETSESEWLVVLEEDAVPVPDFRAHAEAALAWAPSPLVSFYLGTGTNWGVQHAITVALWTAKREGLAWLGADCLMSTVGYAVNRSVIVDLLTDIDATDDELPVAITRSAQARDLAVHYTWPSLIDHRDGWSTIGGREITGRVAHQHGVAPDWDTSIAPLGAVPGWSARESV